MYSETAGITMLKMRALIPASGDKGKDDEGRTAMIHYVMFKLAQSRDFVNVTGVEMAAGLDIQPAYGSEWPKYKRLVEVLRAKGELPC